MINTKMIIFVNYGNQIVNHSIFFPFFFEIVQFIAISLCYSGNQNNKQ